MGATRQVQTPGRAINRQAIPPALAANFEFLDDTVSGLGSSGSSSIQQTTQQ
jgi:hypothetical protein